MTMTARIPTAQEQLMLEYINRIRLDPSVEEDFFVDPATGRAVQSNIQVALDYFNVSYDEFRKQMAGVVSVAPLAWNGALSAASDGHNAVMIAHNLQTHQAPGELSLDKRVEAQGYTGWRALGENVHAYAEDMLHSHAAFVIDWGVGPHGIQSPAGHRDTMMSRNFTEIGISVTANQPQGSMGVGPFVVTQNYGTRANYTQQLVGVVIDDADLDKFYDIGEGLGGITITASGAAGTFTTTSWASGGYQMELPAGSYSVSFAGNGLVGTATYTVTIGAQNVKLDAFAADAVVAPQIPNLWLAGTPWHADQLVGEAGNDVLMGDGFYAWHSMDEAKQVYRLFEAMLARKPGAEGQLTWVKLLNEGSAELVDVANGFINSNEFQSKYGGLDNAAFVTQLFVNVLGRPPAAAGLQTWVSQLESGASRAQVVLGFSESNEFKTKTDAAATLFTEQRDPANWSGEVYRLFKGVLDRDPVMAGMETWSKALASGTSLLSAISGFVNGPEFQAKYGALDNAGFVNQLFVNILGRPPAPAGMTSWMDRMDAGMTRSEVVFSLVQSQEYINATNQALKVWMWRQGLDDALAGGAGSNDLYGGAMVDAFIFDAADAGTHRVHDFEAWDVLYFGGFGFTSADQALAQFSQSGADLVFNYQGTSITLLGTQLAEIEVSNFII